MRRRKTRSTIALALAARDQGSNQVKSATASQRVSLHRRRSGSWISNTVRKVRSRRPRRAQPRHPAASPITANPSSSNSRAAAGSRWSSCNDQGRFVSPVILLRSTQASGLARVCTLVCYLRDNVTHGGHDSIGHTATTLQRRCCDQRQRLRATRGFVVIDGMNGILGLPRTVGDTRWRGSDFVRADRQSRHSTEKAVLSPG